MQLHVGAHGDVAAERHAGAWAALVACAAAWLPSGPCNHECFSKGTIELAPSAVTLLPPNSVTSTPSAYGKHCYSRRLAAQLGSLPRACIVRERARVGQAVGVGCGGAPSRSQACSVWRSSVTPELSSVTGSSIRLPVSGSRKWSGTDAPMWLAGSPPTRVCAYAGACVFIRTPASSPCGGMRSGGSARGAPHSPGASAPAGAAAHGCGVPGAEETRSSPGLSGAQAVKRTAQEARSQRSHKLWC